VGGNASGKSFFRKIIQCVCQEAEVEVISISMQRRINHDGNPGLAFVYGDEEWCSTGENSAKTVLGAIRTSQVRTNRHVIFWDEPDIGLSDEWSASVGLTIREFIENATDSLVTAIVVTHNKSLLRPLRKVKPHFMCFGDNPSANLKEWLIRPLIVRPLSELKDESVRRFKLIQKILNHVRQ
jgi:hypothetical protein